MRKILYFPHIVPSREKRLILLLLFIVFLSGGVSIVRLYHRFTVEIPKVGGTYTEGALHEPRAINPLYAANDTERDLVKLLYSGLITYDGEGNPLPDLAERYEISTDGKTYTVFLRKNVAWHDGHRFSADDVLYTVKTIQNPQYKSVLRANWQGVSVEKLDQDTIRFTLRSPYAPFIENLSTGILPKHLWENITPEQALLHELNLKPVGSGPYRFASLGQAKDGSLNSFSLVRNSVYYREGPYIKNVLFRFFRTEEDLGTAWRKGIIDGFGPVAQTEIERLNPQKEVIRTLRMPRVFGLFFNQKKSSILQEKKVRDAIAFAINKTELVQKAASGGAIVTALPVPFLAENDPVLKNSLERFDLERASALLADAGWKDENGDGIREKKTQNKKETTTQSLTLTLSTSDWPDLLRSAELIQKELLAVGIDVKIEKHTFNELENEVIRPRNFEILLFGEAYGYEEDPFTFWHSSQIKDPGLNVALYANKKADSLLEDARRMYDTDARSKKLQEFVKLFLDDRPAVFLYTQLYLYLLPNDIHGVMTTKISLPADRFNEINKWYRKTGRSFK